MTQDTIAFLETVIDGRVHLLGCSDGAIVGLLLVALRRPDLVDHLVLVAGVFHYEGWLAHVIDPSNQPPEFLAGLYAEVSAGWGGPLPGRRRQAGPDAHRGAGALAR